MCFTKFLKLKIKKIYPDIFFMLIQVYCVLFCLLHIWMEITLFNYMLCFVAEYTELTQIELKIENQKIKKENK